MKDNFDIHAWNINRYKQNLQELEIDKTYGGDDPKIGSEQESDDNVVGENQSHLEFLAKYLNSMHPELDWEVRFGERIDAYGSQRDLFDFGNKYHGKKFGDYEVFHVDDDDRLDIVRIVKSSKLRGGINEASYMYKGYEDKHFDICPVAETLRDELLAGKFKDNSWATGTDFEKEVGEWRYQHDVLFKTEKQVLQDKEGDESDVEKAEVAIDRIVNLSRDLGIPADRLDYLKAHLKKITDIVEYSSLTEENNLPLKLQWQGNFPSQQEVDDNFSSWQRETHYLAHKPVEEWDEYDLSNYNSISRKGGKYGFNPIKETVKFIKENNPEFTTEEIATELKEIKMLGSQLDEEKSKLCKRGRDYIAARKRAGEKSSAYLSGRGVKVCKGQIKGTKGKKRKDYKK